MHLYKNTKCKIFAWKQLSLDRKDMKISMVLGFTYQVSLCLNESLGPGNLLMDAWAHLELWCRRHLWWNKIIKQWWRNQYSIIFRIEKASILLDPPLNLFGNSYYYTYFTLKYEASHLIQAFEWTTIPITPLDIPPMMNTWSLEKIYLLTEDIFFQTISYVMMSFN